MWKPLTRAGRQTLVYVCLAGCGPTLTGVMVWDMLQIRGWEGANPQARLDKFSELAFMNAGGLMIIVIALACFVSIRAIKIGRDGIEATGDDGDDPNVTTVTATATVATPPGTTVQTGTGE